MSRVRIFLACALLSTINAVALAAPVADELLLGPASFSNPSLSPDGKRMAVVIDTGHAQRALVIGELEAGTFRPVMKTSVPGLVAVDHYVWVSSQVLLIWVDVGAGDGDMWAVVDTRTRVLVQMHHPYANLVRTNWGDAEHVLISSLCGRDELCLYNWNLRLNDGLPVGKPLLVATTWGFEVIGDNDIVTRPADGTEQARLRWNSKSQQWEPYSAPAAAAAEPATGTTEGFATAKRRFAQLEAADAASPMLYTSGSRQVVGVDLLATPGLRALHPDLEAPAIEVGKALHGQQIHWIEISDDLATALIGAHQPGAPETYYLWTRAAGLQTLQQSRPELANAHLSQSHVMKDWFGDGTAVAVMLPALGAPHGPLLIRTILGENERAALQATVYDGALQSLAQHGLTIVTVPVPVGAGGGEGAAWRQWVAQRVARAAEHAVQMGLTTRNRICVWGEDFGGYAALAAVALASQPGYACVLLVNVPLQFDSLSKPLYSHAGNVDRTFLVSPTRVATFHSLWVADEQADHTAGDPVNWAGQMPSQVFLAYRMYAGATGAGLKWGASGFESALKKAGKNLQLYTPESHFDEPFKWEAGLYESMAAAALQAAPP
jgi:hypothetical protein